MLRLSLLTLALCSAVALVACGNGSDGPSGDAPAPSTSAPGTPGTPGTPGPPSVPPSGPVVATFTSAGSRLQVSEVATGLDTVWSLAWDPAGALWFTERPGRVTRLGERPQAVAGVQEMGQQGEGGLMGLEIDGRGRRFLMYTSAEDNRIVRLEPDGSQRVVVQGIEKAIFQY